MFPAFGQETEAANPVRITQVVDDSVLTTLKGNVHPLAKQQYDKGPVDTSLPAERMQLLLQRSPGQELALRQLLGSLQDPHSPNYRKWLTPEQMGIQFGVSDADIQTVSKWLVSEGFTVNKVNKAHSLIEFSGTVGRIQSAFHTQIHNFEVHGENHLANVSDPQIPAALSPVVAGITSLNNFFPKPQYVKSVPGKYDKASNKLVPELTLGSASEGYFLFVVPGDAATIYDTPNSMNVNFKGGTSYDGSGVTIGIAGVSDIDISTIGYYRLQFGLPAAIPVVTIDGNDPGINGAEDEAYLDLEVSGGIAPAADQIFYASADTNFEAGLFLAIVRAIDDNAIGILNVSFLGCEAFQGTTGNQFINGLWEQAAAQGISVTVSSGDSGSAGCDNENTETQANDGLQVNGLASTPFNIAVGGTDYDVLATNFLTYALPTSSNRTNYSSALGYIPEEPWNNSTDANGQLSANTPYKDPTTGDTNIVAAGGGASSCVLPQYDSHGNLTGCGIESGTVTGWPKPSWQTGGNLNIPADGVRDLPDLSLLAANGLYGATWLVCTDDIDSNGNTHNCAANSGGEFYFDGIGGTSASAPAFAGMLALISESQGGARLGQADFVLYNLANQPSLYGSLFHDVTEGNNSVYCLLGSADCGSNSFVTGYNSGTAYDQASGLGSVDVTQLIDSWAKASFTPTTTALTVNGGTALVNITHGQSVTLNTTVTGTTPTGDVAIISNTNGQPSDYSSNGLGFFSLTNGATGPVSYSNLPGGSYYILANYGGDVANAQSLSNGVQVTVAKENSVLNLFALPGIQSASNTPITLSGSYPYGTAFSIDAQPIGESQVGSQTPAPATGTVTFADTAGEIIDIAASAAINSRGIAEFPIHYWSPATHAISANYSGDNSFNPSASKAPLTFTIAKAPTTNTVSTNPSVITKITFQLSSLITPTPSSFATAPSGMVTFTVGGTSLGSSGVGPLNPQTVAVSGVTINIDSSSLAVGTNLITATYAGDTNYAGSTGTVSVTYSPAPESIALSSTAASVSSPGQVGTSTITITPTNYMGGTVKLTCVLASSPAGADATYNPGCNVPAPTSVTSSGAVTVTANFTTSAPSSGTLAYPRTNRWSPATGGAVMACILLFGIPARRRGWRSILGLLVFLVAMAGMGCGGGGGAGNNNNNTPGTSTGTYTFTVTGTDSVTSTITANTTVTLTVN